MRMKRFLLLAVLSLLIVAPLSVMAQDEPIEINFYYPVAVDAPAAQILQGYADSFHEANPNITINLTYTGSYTQTTQTIQTEMSGGGAGPDVAVMLSTDLLTFTEAGTIVPVQDYIDKLDDPQAFMDDQFPALMLNSEDEDGKIWSLPFQRSTPILYYNVQMLKDAGFDNPPKNNEELLTDGAGADQARRLAVGSAGSVRRWLPDLDVPELRHRLRAEHRQRRPDRSLA